MALNKLVFDVTDYTAIAASANVGAYVRSGKSGALVTNRSSVFNPGISFTFVDADIIALDDTITEAAHGLQTGDVVQFSTTTTLPTPLAAATDYFVIRVSSSLIKIASSAANAENGIALDLADDGSGTHTLTSQEVAKRALDVHVGNAIDVDLDYTTDSITAHQGGTWTATVTATQLDIDDLDYTIDSVTAHQGGTWTIDSITNAVTVTATDLDIRDLAFASDSVDVSGSSVSITGDVAVTQSTSPWVVSATQLDIDDLNATDDAVAAWVKDGAGNSIGSTTGALNVHIASGDLDDSLANVAIKVVAETVGTSLAQIVDGADELALRKWVYLYNNGNKQMCIGPLGTTLVDGFPIFPGSLLELRVGAAVDVYAIAEAPGQNMRTMQLS